ncbi:Tumor necrosis factor receptor superfamily member 5 [Anabarilius grahami]|uniref:Tumor necrosis factor receptor superfamily member 5 n=1 Tax=Anabarilius grahami TaxID=495550 RepID=A0A3N0Z0Z7_ANAGA|nr:Tumor necrosis factor receptor superfamily member 5 [Anabarilius grahami]
MRTVFVLYLLVTLVYHVSCCEKETHYMKDGKCCKMCGPGKRMLVGDKCEDPACQDCPNGEYQSGYTSETKCERQPSCDTNLHFKPQEAYPSKTGISKCECEPGYYCTKEDDCNTCMKHTVCKPGQRVAKKDVNMDMMKTLLALQPQIGPVFTKVDPKTTVSNFKKKPQETDVERAVQPLQQQPEEDIDSSVPVSPTPSNMTENGNYVVQERGKEHIVSSTETNSYSYS